MLTCCAQSETGHVGGCAGVVEILTALYFGGVLRYDLGAPRCPARDRLLLRGHLGPTRYAIFSLLGWLETAELARHATLGSDLEGHESHTLPGVDIGPSGSLGMILSQGSGAAVAAQNKGWRTFVILGDGEEQEGNIAEAAREAAAAHVTNLVVIIDGNGRQLSGPTASADAADVPGLWRAYGWRTMELPSGNDVIAARDSLQRASEVAANGPVAVVAHTTKGYGLPGAARHFSGYHELAHCPPGLVQPTHPSDHNGLQDEISSRGARARGQCPSSGPRDREPDRPRPHMLGLVDDNWASLPPDEFQLRYLTALAEAWDDDEHGVLHFLYADTFPEPLLAKTGLATAARCRNVGIREQHLVAMAHGLSVSDPGAVVLIHTGDAFVPRAIDQLNAAALGGGRFVLLADDAGITNCRNGVSHQSALTARIVSTVPEVTVVEPADGVDFALAATDALHHRGITYIRVHDAAIREPIAVETAKRSTTWYETGTSATGRPDVAFLATGFVVGEAIAAAHELSNEGIQAKVVNVIQPGFAGKAARPLIDDQVPIVTVYDGDPDTLADPVRRAFASARAKPQLATLGYRRGRSGRLDELLAWAGLDSQAIVASAGNLLADCPATPEVS